eukprot:4599474-Pyramimonas_sp.AAC.1
MLAQTIWLKGSRAQAAANVPTFQAQQTYPHFKRRQAVPSQCKPSLEVPTEILCRARPAKKQIKQPQAWNSRHPKCLAGTAAGLAAGSWILMDVVGVRACEFDVQGDEPALGRMPRTVGCA